LKLDCQGSPTLKTAGPTGTKNGPRLLTNKNTTKSKAKKPKKIFFILPCLFFKDYTGIQGQKQPRFSEHEQAALVHQVHSRAGKAAALVAGLRRASTASRAPAGAVGRCSGITKKEDRGVAARVVL